MLNRHSRKASWEKIDKMGRQFVGEAIIVLTTALSTHLAKLLYEETSFS
jgi:hypothetical protein